MKAKINIICLYWVGEFRKRDFTPIDVYRLYKSVWRHIDRDFDFYVLTNDMKVDVPGIKIELLHGDKWPGWWSKMELHRSDLPPGRTLYMDLDSHVIRDLKPILDYEGDLVMFPHKTNPNKKRHGLVHRYQAATMLFTPGRFEDMYEEFKANDAHWMRHFRSDQDVMGEWIPDQPTFPDEWLMKLGSIEKRRALRLHPPKDVIIVTGQTKNGGFRKTHEIPWFEKMARG